MPAETSTPSYLLGSTDAEHQRLIRQAAMLDPITERFLRDAGVGPGQRVLDLGSGLGDVSMLAARLVGHLGAVIGIVQRCEHNREGKGSCSQGWVSER
jgi:Protein-L-isoaspartate(D-aspartate) O-methyltransferase (PCMT)